MKKIMMIACAIALASAVHAAAAGWSLAGANNYAGDAYSFFVIGQNGVTDVKQIATLLTEGTDVGKYAVGSGTIALNGSANVTAKNSGLTLDVDGSTSYEGFYVIFDAATADKAQNYVAVTSAQAAKLIQTPGASATSFTFTSGSQADYINSASNWSKVGSGVPEPTSGLLLLMGMAALALKRKVA